MSSFGKQTIPNTVGHSIQVSADGVPEMKEIGITLDWDTVTAQSGSDATWLDGVILKIGKKGLRYGTILAKITASGKFGPYESTASDGREIRSLGRVYILNVSVLQDDAKSDHPPVLEGGRVWKERLLIGNAPLMTEAQLLTVMPRLKYVSA